MRSDNFQHPESLSAHYGRLVSCTLPCPEVSIAGFLHQAEGHERFYWEDHSQGLSFAGSGTAVELMAWGKERFHKIEQQARELFDTAIAFNEPDSRTGPRLFGGFAFRDDFTPDNTWSIYAPAYFVLPHYQLVSIGGEKWLTINTQIPLDEDHESIREDLLAALQAKIEGLRAGETRAIDYQQSRLHDISYPMSYAAWERMISEATRRIRDGELNKVVLSRVSEAQFEGRVNILGALRYLADNYRECYRFLFEPRPHYAFYGATPELLAGVNGSRIETMGLAGSIRRGKSAEEDRALGQELLNSSKDRHEHDIVVQMIRARLQDITHSLDIAPVGLYTLSNIQHLHTRISGELKDASGILSVVEALHPTPALGGDPRERALELISSSEPLPRGWYGAPVGWIDRNLDGQFGVAIRSAVAQEKRVWMYAGAGIVADSIPQKEWDETALKFRPMLNALGIQEATQEKR